MKTYVLMVSTTYPAYHLKKGQRTYFPEKILAGLIPCGLISIEQMTNFNQNCYGFSFDAYNSCDPKLHTIRAKYDTWVKRMQEVNEGKAVISLRYHTLGRYVKGNKQIEFARLDKDSGCGVQKLKFGICGLEFPMVETSDSYLQVPIIAKNDGLTKEDFTAWFKPYNLSEPMAILHFTNFRY